MESRPLLSFLFIIGSDARILRRCISALNSQTFNDAEIIVSDHSFIGYTDALQRKLNPPAVPVTIVPGDARISLWQQLKDTVARARGKYVIFVNPAQWLEPDTAERLVDCMERYNADVAEIRSVKCIKGVAVKNENPVPEEIPADRLVENGELHTYSRFIGDDSYISSSIYDKIYRRDLLTEVFSIDYKGHKSVEEMVNVHYLRTARNMVFLSYGGLNFNWETAPGEYSYSALDDAKLAYTHKMLSGQDEESCRSELAGRLSRHVRMLMLDSGWTPEATLFFVRREMEDPFWAHAGITVTAEELVDSVDRREKWLDFSRILSRILH